MSARDDHDILPEEHLPADQREAQRAVRALGVPPLDDSFRARLREKFVRGEFSDAEGVRSETTVVPFRRGRGLTRYAVPLSLAAVLVLMFGWLNQGSSWEVVRFGDATSHVLVDGQRMPCDDLDPIQAALHPGCRVELPEGGQMEIVSDGNLLLQLNDRVEMTLPAPPGRWLGRRVESEITGEGTLRVATGRAFEGARYRLRTGETVLAITGTTFALDHDAEVTCLCVLEGEVAVILPDGERRSVGAGGRITLHEASGRVDTGDIEPEEIEKLGRLRSRADRLG